MLSKGATADCGFAEIRHVGAVDDGDAVGDGEGDGLGKSVGLADGWKVTSSVGEGLGVGEGSMSGDGDGVALHCFSCRQPNASKAAPTKNKATSLFPKFIFSSPLLKPYPKRLVCFFQEL
jgi:hypothetical protein